MRDQIKKFVGVTTPIPIPIDDTSKLFASYADMHEKKGTWHGKSILFWYVSLIEEVIELGLSLLHLHKHKPSLELMQISSVAINFSRELNRRHTGMKV